MRQAPQGEWRLQQIVRVAPQPVGAQVDRLRRQPADIRTCIARNPNQL